MKSRVRGWSVSLLFSCFVNQHFVESFVPTRPSIKVILPSNYYSNFPLLQSASETDGGSDGEPNESKVSAGWSDKVPQFNTVHLAGRLGNDPEPKYLEGGKVVLNLSLAVKRKYHPVERKALKIKSGEESTDWFGLELWGQSAEFAAKFADKGMKVSVIGTLKLDQWTNKETGEPRSRVKVLVREFDILETRAESELRRSKRGSSNGGPFYDEGDATGMSSAGGMGGFFDD